MTPKEARLAIANTWLEPLIAPYAEAHKNPSSQVRQLIRDLLSENRTLKIVNERKNKLKPDEPPEPVLDWSFPI